MRTVLTIGTFDLLHLGHMDFLLQAAIYGDALIVGVISDELVEFIKGEKPVIPAEARAELLGMVHPVDHAIVIENTDYEAVVRRIKPNVLALSVDHTALRFEQAAAWVNAHGGQVIRIPRSPRESTSAIKARMTRS